MSSFTDEPTFTLSNDGLTATIVEGFRYFIGENFSDRYIDIEAEFVTDGMTLPHVCAVLRPFAPRWAYIKAVLVHDKLCKTKSVYQIENDVVETVAVEQMFQKEIDREFYTALKALGMSKYKAWIFYQAVSIYQFSKALKQELNVF